MNVCRLALFSVVCVITASACGGGHEGVDGGRGVDAAVDARMTPDGGMVDDGGTLTDSGLDAGPIDSGTLVDSGPLVDGGTPTMMVRALDLVAGGHVSTSPRFRLVSSTVFGGSVGPSPSSSRYVLREGIVGRVAGSP